MDGSLSSDELGALVEHGFVVIPGPVLPADLVRLSKAYDQAVESADPHEISKGGTTTRVHDFVNRGPEFDAMYVHPPVLAACCHVIARPFKLSSMLARTLRAHSPAQDLHVDNPSTAGCAMLNFIFMVDEFRRENGATRFMPGSHNCPEAGSDRDILACGPAGSMILYNGWVRHGHAANISDVPRRSIQGAYIQREAPSGFDFKSRMRSDTLARIGPLAKYLLAIEHCS